MATQRKTGASRPKAKKAVKKSAPAARPKAAAKAASHAAKARPATTASRSAPAKGHSKKIAGPPAPSKGAVRPPGKADKVAAKAVTAKGKVAGSQNAKTAAGAKPGAKGGAAPGRPARPAGKPIIRVVERTPAANVRPIGALPPEAVARATHKTHVASPVRASAPIRPAREKNRHDSGAQGVTDQDYKEFEQRLIDERRKIMKEMGYLENTVLKVNQRDSSGDLSGYSFHMADVGTDAMEREKAFLFASSEGRLLMEIDVALRKVYAGEYGACEVCEKPISRARLEAMPYARLCLECKQREEREGRAGGTGGPATGGSGPS